MTTDRPNNSKKYAGSIAAITVLILGGFFLSAGCQPPKEEAATGGPDRGTIAGKIANLAAAPDVVKSYDQEFSNPEVIEDFERAGYPHPETVWVYQDRLLGNGRPRVKEGVLVVSAETLQIVDAATSAPLGQTEPRLIAWLDKPLPPTFSLEMDVIGRDSGRDLNFFICGNKGMPSGYEIMIGGHGGSKNGLYVWPNEDVASRWYGDQGYPRSKMGGSTEYLPLSANHTYKLKIERDGVEIRVWLDGTLILREEEEHEVDAYANAEEYELAGSIYWEINELRAKIDSGEELEEGAEDPNDAIKRLEASYPSLKPVSVAPILDPEARYFGVSTWANEISIDNLKIREIEPSPDLAEFMTGGGN